MLGEWPCPLPDGGTANELLLSLGGDGSQTVLIAPPFFDEHNKLRRQMVEIMRRLAEAGIGSTLPDLPGWNESAQPLGAQNLATWRAAMTAMAEHVGATHVLTFRCGALLAPEGLSGWKYAPHTGAKQLRGMIRAAVIAARESGREMSSDALMAEGRENGLTLAGWEIGPQLFRDLADADDDGAPHLTEISQKDVGGRGLWLRAEPDEDADQADALARLLAEELATP